MICNYNIYISFMQFTLSDKMCETWLGLTSPNLCKQTLELKFVIFIFIFLNSKTFVQIKESCASWEAIPPGD